jgi:hypothetical protein
MRANAHQQRRDEHSEQQRGRHRLRELLRVEVRERPAHVEVGAHEAHRRPGEQQHDEEREHFPGRLARVLAVAVPGRQHAEPDVRAADQREDEGLHPAELRPDAEDHEAEESDDEREDPEPAPPLALQDLVEGDGVGVLLGAQLGRRPAVEAALRRA